MTSAHCGSALLVPEHPRGDPHPPGEQTREVRRIIDPDLGSDLPDRQFTAGEQLLGAREPGSEDKLVGRQPCRSPHLLAELDDSETAEGGALGDREILGGRIRRVSPDRIIPSL